MGTHALGGAHVRRGVFLARDSGRILGEQYFFARDSGRMGRKPYFLQGIEGGGIRERIRGGRTDNSV